MIHDAASEARNTTALAMSSGSPIRRRGRRAAIDASPGSHNALAMAVRTSPGATEFTRTEGPSSAASCDVRWITAAFVTFYQPMPGSTDMPPIDATFTTEPPCPAMWARHAAWVQKSGPSWFTCTVLADLLPSISIIGP